jgi:hypothetical protein
VNDNHLDSDSQRVSQNWHVKPIARERCMRACWQVLSGTNQVNLNSATNLSGDTAQQLINHVRVTQVPWYFILAAVTHFALCITVLEPVLNCSFQGTQTSKQQLEIKFLPFPCDSLVGLHVWRALILLHRTS